MKKNRKIDSQSGDRKPAVAHTAEASPKPQQAQTSTGNTTPPSSLNSSEQQMQSQKEADRKAAMEQEYALRSGDVAAQDYIKNELFLDQILAPTDVEFEDIIKRAKKRAASSPLWNTTPVRDGLQIYGHEVTEGELKAQRLVRDIINMAEMLRKFRAQRKRGI